MIERTYTLLRAILYLKDVLGSENIFCINIHGGKGKSVEMFLIYICPQKKSKTTKQKQTSKTQMSSSPINAYLRFK